MKYDRLYGFAILVVIVGIALHIGYANSAHNAGTRPRNIGDDIYISIHNRNIYKKEEKLCLLCEKVAQHARSTPL